MPTLEEIQEAFSKDHYGYQLTGCRIRSVEPGRSVCELPLRAEHYNPLGTVHGGAIFTLGDHAFGVAANAFAERVTLSMQHDITYFGKPRGKILIAVARCVRAGRSTTFYEVEITDDLGTQVARMTVNGFTLNRRVADVMEKSE